MACVAASEATLADMHHGVWLVRLHGVLCDVAALDIKEVPIAKNNKEPEQVCANFMASEPVLKAGGCDHFKTFCSNQTQICAHADAEAVFLEADLMDLAAEAAKGQVEVHLCNTTKDDMVGLNWGTAKTG